MKKNDEELVVTYSGLWFLRLPRLHAGQGDSGTFGVYRVQEQGL